jgi:uncharacterized protein YegP (UPF0339 family)
MCLHPWLIALGAAVVLFCDTGGSVPFTTGRLWAAQRGGAKLKFEMYQDAGKEYRWRLKAANGAVLASSGQGYKAKADCAKGVERLKEQANTDKLTFEVYEDSGKQFRWRVKASNGQVVGSSSESYKAKADCEKAIDLVKKGAASATVEDQT